MANISGVWLWVILGVACASIPPFLIRRFIVEGQKNPHNTARWFYILFAIMFYGALVYVYKTVLKEYNQEVVSVSLKVGALFVLLFLSYLVYTEGLSAIEVIGVILGIASIVLLSSKLLFQ